MRLKGSYTVEAAIIMGFCMIVFCAAVGVAYDTFSQSVQYVDGREEEFDAVKIFRGKEDLAELFNRN